MSLISSTPLTWILLATFVALACGEPAICGKLPRLPRGTVTYSAGDTIARYSCTVSGYRLEGNRMRRCMNNGTWSGERPHCREVQKYMPRISMCERPEPKEYLIQRKFAGRKREGLWIVGTILQFSCDVGFRIVSDYYPSLECTYRGWNYTVPSCSEIRCFRPWSIENGETVVYSTAVGSTVTFTCESGFHLIGDSVLSCQENGLWNGNIPFCDNGDPRGGSIPLEHAHGVDLYFVFDDSDRVGMENFEKMKRFAKELVRKIGVTRNRNSLRVGAVSFSYDAVINFHTLSFTSNNDVIKQGINRIPYRGGSTSNINEALRLVYELMIPQSEQRRGSYKAIFILTDAITNQYGFIVPGAQALKEQGIKIHCLGISEDASRHGLYAIASQPYRKHVFLLKDYRYLTELVAAIINQTVDYSECGVSENTVSRGRVVGGNDANPGAWPWQVLLDITIGSNRLKCGGVLIDRYWVLTTAFCVSYNAEYKITVVLGMTDLSRPSDQEIEVKEVITYPDRNPLTYQNEIALLKLKKPAALNANVRPVCLPSKTRADRLIPPNPSSIHTAVITGWGHNKSRTVNDQTEGQGVDRLQQLALPLRSREDCRASLLGKREQEYFDESMFCAGYENALLGACIGDSGGPLVKRGLRQRQRRWILIGLINWGMGCAVENEFDFFTNVPYFMDWITETMNLKQEEGGGEV